MHDDGVHADLAPNDGIYGAVIEALAPGQYMAQSVFKGVTVDGVAFERSTEHSFHVVNPYITLTGTPPSSHVRRTLAHARLFTSRPGRC
jgi:hypothetical protein